MTTMAHFGLLILRVVVGLSFALHGWQKFNEFTIAATQASFRKIGVPLPEVAAPAVATLELAGGVALILGLLTRVFAALLTLDMLGAMFLVHLPNGFFVSDNGIELVLLLAAASLEFALAGAGRYSADNKLLRGRRTRWLSRLA